MAEHQEDPAELQPFVLKLYNVSRRNHTIAVARRVKIW